MLLEAHTAVVVATVLQVCKSPTAAVWNSILLLLENSQYGKFGKNPVGENAGV